MSAIDRIVKAHVAARSAQYHIGKAGFCVDVNDRPAALASLTSAHVAALELIEAIVKAKEELK